ncbi:preprotein translocase subunit SecG [Leeuwenhoekiella aestuarii]|uniref:Protein-export membrane protein SecG n=1 Tax=Leeuwenhoekiella aestuarii TaxID=2249426 RepID=A0A4Q0NQK8_9FLAO|nr:preprotein translocase subunit SecG [Leeuwenhoekiella aestuarii]RXG12688.1 preprotein translocase subunit SecG [Leeuwenhoekiella aestuarii]RXG14635.1 preprotein translocase subunit SecG [Leeuwenhoekiella aestuarii]
MFFIFLVLIVIVAFLLIVVIMVQNPKGGGLSSSFGGGGSQQIGGVKKTGDFLDKSTWGLATALLVLILISNVTIFGGGSSNESKVIEGENVENIMPVQESPAPAATAPTTDSTEE